MASEKTEWEDIGGFIPFRNLDKEGMALSGYFIKQGHFKYKDGSDGTKLIFSEDDKGTKLFSFGANALLKKIFEKVEPGMYIQIIYTGPNNFTSKAGKKVKGRGYDVKVAKNVKQIKVETFQDDRL